MNHVGDAAGRVSGLLRRVCASRGASCVRAGITLGGIALLLAAAAQPARAQSPARSKWLVLPSVAASKGDPKHPARAAARLLADDLRQSGTRTFDVEEAKLAFEQHGSAPPMTASAADIDELAKDAQRALYHVASGLPTRAKNDVEKALARARRALESLNRETRAAQHLLDACLYLVRAHLQNDARVEARRQALECKRLVPDISPEPTIHPPDVIGVLAEAQAQLQTQEPSSLRVESEPMGCAAYVNGRNLGPTPKELSQLSPGEYRIQVECEQGVMGRVHRIALSTQRIALSVDTRYDRVIETLFDISLEYDSASEQSRYLAHDALDTARAISATDVVVAWQRDTAGDTAHVQLDRYRVADGVLLSTVRVPVSVKASSVPAALLASGRQSLQDGESLDLTGPVPSRLDLPAPVAEDRSAEPARLQPSAVGAQSVEDDPLAHDPITDEPPADDGIDGLTTAGLVTGGAGLAAQAAGWVLYAKLAGAQSDYAAALNANSDPSMRTTAELTALRDLDDADDAPPIVLGVGAAVTAVSVPLWLPKARGMPWWAWVSGGAGVALAGVGAVLIVGAASCDEDRYGRCTTPALATDIGPMLVLQAVPFLTLPVVQGVRAATDGGADVAFEVGAGRALLRIEGRL